MSAAILQRHRFIPATEDLDFYVSAEAPEEDVAHTLDNTAPADGLAHQVIIDSSGDINTIVFTVVGTDADDKAISETITGVTTSPVESAKYFKTVTSITPDGTSAETVTAGFVDEFVSPSIMLNWKSAVGAKFWLDVTGTLATDIQFSIADPALFNHQNANLWVEPDSDLVNESADSSAPQAIDAGYVCWRVQMLSYSAGAVLDVYVSQPA